MSAGDLPAPPPSPERRDRVLEVLSQHFAAGRIELEDMERRMEIAARARTAADLEAALAGITPAAKAAVPAAPVSTAVAPARERPRRTLAFLGGHRRAGRWSAPAYQKASAVMGGIQLDYREAVMAQGESELELSVFWGGVQIIVPPDLEVEVEGSAFLGGIHNGAMEPEGQGRAVRRLRITARVIMGGVDVKVMDREAVAALPPGTRPPRDMP